MIQYWKEKEKEGEDGGWENKDKNAQEDKRRLEGRNENGQTVERKRKERSARTSALEGSWRNKR